MCFAFRNARHIFWDIFIAAVAGGVVGILSLGESAVARPGILWGKQSSAFSICEFQTSGLLRPSSSESAWRRGDVAFEKANFALS